MRTDFSTVELDPEIPFRIARGTTETIENVVVEIEHGGETGYGAAAPSAHYGETPGTVEAVLPELLAAAEAVGDPHARRAVGERMDEIVMENPAAKAAVDVALWDLSGKLLGIPVYRLLGTDVTGPLPPTSITVGIDETQAMADRAREAVDDGYSTLKLKLGTERDREIVESVREAAPSASIRVDANGAWTPKRAVERCRELAEFDVEFVEQPVPGEDLAGLAYVYERSPLPIAADESCRVATDVPEIAECCDIANLKLMKTGGLTPALDLIHAAHANGIDVMCGCMLETNAAIAGAVHLLPLLRYADLDGSMLLADDPYSGVPAEAGRFDLTAIEAGTGARPR